MERFHSLFFIDFGKKYMIAHQVCKNLETLFHDKKDAKVVQLDNELCKTTIGDSKIIEYYTRIKTVDDLIDNIDVAVPKKNIVMYTIIGLSFKIDYIANLICHRVHVRIFMKTISMLLLEEQCIGQNHTRTVKASNMENSSYPMIIEHSNMITEHSNSINLSNNIQGGYNCGGRGGRCHDRTSEHGDNCDTVNTQQ